MSQEGCISHPPGLYFVQRRSEYLGILDDDKCAAELLSLFEFWTNCRIGQGEAPDQIWLHEDMDNIREGLLFGYSEKIVRRAACLLESKGLVKRSKVFDLVKLGVLEGTGDPFKDRWIQDWLYQFQVKAVQTAVNYWFRSRSERQSAFLPNAKQKDLKPINFADQPEADFLWFNIDGKTAETPYPMHMVEMPEHFDASTTGEDQEKGVLSPETLYPMHVAEMPERFDVSADYLKESNLRKNLERERDQDRSRVRRKKLIIRTRKAEQPSDQPTGENNMVPAPNPAEPSNVAQDECSAALLAPIFDKANCVWHRINKAGDELTDPRFLKFMVLQAQAKDFEFKAASKPRVGNALRYALGMIHSSGEAWYGQFEHEFGLVADVPIPAPAPDPPLAEIVPEPDLIPDSQSPEPAKKSRRAKAAKPPKDLKYSEPFMRWWGTEPGFKDTENGWYYWALSVGASPGDPLKSWKSWQKVSGDGEPSEEFIQGDRAFRDWKTEEFVAKGQAIGVPNGERYIPAHYKRKEALDRPAALRTSTIHTPHSTTFDPNNIAFIAMLASRYLPDLPGYKAPVTIATAKATLTESRMAAKLQVFWDEWQRSLQAPENISPVSKPADLSAGTHWQDELKIRQGIDIVAVYADQQGEFVVHLPNDSKVMCEELRSLPTWEAVKAHLAKISASKPPATSRSLEFAPPDPEVIALRAEITQLEDALHVGVHRRRQMTRLAGSASGALYDMGLDLLNRYRDDLRLALPL